MLPLRLQQRRQVVQARRHPGVLQAEARLPRQRIPASREGQVGRQADRQDTNEERTRQEQQQYAQFPRRACGLCDRQHGSMAAWQHGHSNLLKQTATFRCPATRNRRPLQNYKITPIDDSMACEKQGRYIPTRPHPLKKNAKTLAYINFQVILRHRPAPIHRRTENAACSTSHPEERAPHTTKRRANQTKTRACTQQHRLSYSCSMVSAAPHRTRRGNKSSPHSKQQQSAPLKK